MKSFLLVAMLSFAFPSASATYCLGTGKMPGFFFHYDYKIGIVSSKLMVWDLDSTPSRTVSCKITATEIEQWKELFNEGLRTFVEKDESTKFRACGVDFEFQITKFKCVGN